MELDDYTFEKKLVKKALPKQKTKIVRNVQKLKEF
jgi:hypothetical protein